MSRRLLGMLRGDDDPEDIAAAIMHALQDATDGLTMNANNPHPEGDELGPNRIDPGVGDPSKDPYSPEGLQQAQLDRLEMMDTLGMTEEDFGDEAIWLIDDDGNVIRDFDDDAGDD